VRSSRTPSQAVLRRASGSRTVRNASLSSRLSRNRPRNDPSSSCRVVQEPAVRAPGLLLVERGSQCVASRCATQ
jgi:hypothetical protein